MYLNHLTLIVMLESSMILIWLKQSLINTWELQLQFQMQEGLGRKAINQDFYESLCLVSMTRH